MAQADLLFSGTMRKLFAARPRILEAAWSLECGVRGAECVEFGERLVRHVRWARYPAAGFAVGFLVELFKLFLLPAVLQNDDSTRV